MLRYFLYVNLFALLFWGLYELFLKNRGDFQWTRIYLLISVILSAVLPLIEIPIQFSSFVVAGKWLHVDTVLKSALPGLADDTGQQNGLIVGYVVIAGVLLLSFAVQLYLLHRFLSRNKAVLFRGDYKILLNTGRSPGSFGHYIFFPSEKIEPMILNHELGHCRHGHYWDQLFYRLLISFYFPVVAFYLIRREAALVREFEADDYAAKDRYSYGRLLLQTHFKTDALLLMSSFFHHPLKRRIMMLSQSKKTVSRRWLITSAVVGVLGLFLFQNLPVGYAQSPQEKQGQKPALDVDQTAQFPGGLGALEKFLANHVHYPKLAKGEDSLTGQVVYQFVIGKNGDVEQAKIIKSLGPKYDKVVLNALHALPVWVPAKRNGQPVASYFKGTINFQ